MIYFFGENFVGNFFLPQGSYAPFFFFHSSIFLKFQILKPVTTKTTTRIPLRPKNATTSSMAPSESSNSNIVLIGGAICGILFVVVLLVILIFVIKKRIVTTRKTTNGKSIKGKKEVIYAEPEGKCTSLNCVEGVIL